ncbi:MAG TPA: ATP-binding protein [Chthoniobacterales bacterium]|jgi:PAS domain S-box-containing protein
MKRGFLDKFLDRIQRVEPEAVQSYILRLAREKGFFERIFNALHEGVIVTDAGSRILYLNQSACALCGLDSKGDMGELLTERVRGLDWDGMTKSDRVVSRDTEIFYPQHRLLNFYVVPFDLGSDTEMKDDEDLGYAVILRDITETQKTTEESLESERFSALTLLSAGVAHEIGNPLNSLHIHLQLMERKIRKLESRQRAALEESVEVAKEEVKRLDYIVNQFLRAIRPTQPQVQKENINAIIEESVSFLAREIDDRNVLVETRLAEDLPLLELDRNQIKQAFYNLIKNSFQAMNTGGILHIASWRGDQHVAVSFTDTGGGISAENMGRIFQPYFTTKENGSGLGLLIVRRIVREHGGEIDLESNEGKGLMITIRLPFGERRIRMLGAPSEEGDA